MSLTAAGCRRSLRATSPLTTLPQSHGKARCRAVIPRRSSTIIAIDSASAENASTHPREGTMIVRTRHESAYLADNMLGDPGERDLFVYLPPGYEESDRRYACAYLLHAFGESA